MEKKILRSLFWVSILITLGFISSNRSWAAEKYPSRPIELICGFLPGGQADFSNRLCAKFLEKYLGVTIVPVNKPGAGGAIATNFVANSRPDGYTILNTGDSLEISTFLGEANYKLEDLRIVAQVFSVAAVIAVSADSPWKTFQEFMDYAKKNPGVRYAFPGVGSSPWILMEDLNKSANLKMVGVPFKGDAESIPAVIGKHVPIGIHSAFGAKTQADAGKIRILFSFEPPAEIGLDPNIPDFTTVFGKTTNFDLANRLVVPAKTPNEIVQVLERVAEIMTKDPEFIVELKKLCFKTGFIDGNTSMKKKLPERMSIFKTLLQDAGLLK